MKDTANACDAGLRATAYQEAGHCVMAIRSGRTIRYVTMTPGKNAMGQVTNGSTVIHRSNGVQSTEQEMANVGAALMCYYAGAICEAAATGKPVDLSTAAEDHKAAVETLKALLGENATPAILQARLVCLYRETQKLLVPPKACRAVRYVADALITRRKLTGTEVKRLVWQAY